KQPRVWFPIHHLPACTRAAKRTGARPQKCLGRGRSVSSASSRERHSSATLLIRRSDGARRAGLGRGNGCNTCNHGIRRPRVDERGRVVRPHPRWTLKAAAGQVNVALELIETQAPVLHGLRGEEGLSRKGPQPGQASYYYSVPRLKTS